MDEKMDCIDNKDGGSESPSVSPPPPNEAATGQRNKLKRRSTLAIARRLSRASAAVGLSLEDQLEIVPSSDEASSDVRLSQVLRHLFINIGIFTNKIL
jgi:hypothetical protein